MYSETVPGIFDIDGDGLWEFTVLRECWIFATCHADAARFWAQVFKPDTANGSYYLGNTEIASFLEPEIETAKAEYERAYSAFVDNKTSRTAGDCSFASEVVLAWLITIQDEGRIKEWLNMFEPVFSEIVHFGGYMYSEYSEIRQKVAEELRQYSDPVLPAR